MMADVGADLQEKRYRILSNDLRSVGGHIDDRDSLFLRVFEIDNIVAGCQNRDRLHIGAAIDRLFADRSLIGHDDLRVTDPLYNNWRLYIGGPVIDRQISQLSERVPAQVSRILRKAVKNYYFHILILSPAPGNRS